MTHRGDNPTSSAFHTHVPQLKKICISCFKTDTLMIAILLSIKDKNIKHEK